MYQSKLFFISCSKCLGITINNTYQKKLDRIEADTNDSGDRILTNLERAGDRERIEISRLLGSNYDTSIYDYYIFKMLKSFNLICV